MDWEERARRNIAISSKGLRHKILQEVRREQNMIRELKLTITPERNLFAFSDPHFFHDRDFIWGKRGFKSSHDHKEGLISKINERVRRNDYLICNGDWSLNATRDGIEETFDRINCENVFVLWGNHNNPSLKLYREQVALQYGLKEGEFGQPEVYPLRYKNIIFVGNYLEMFVNGQHIIFCHYPIAEHNELKRGSWMLCGHSHGGNPLSHTDNKEGLILDLGWELHGKPLSFEEIRAIMATKSLRNVGHH